MNRRHRCPMRTLRTGELFRFAGTEGCIYIKLSGGLGGRYQMTDKEGTEMPGMNTCDDPNTEVEIIR